MLKKKMAHTIHFLHILPSPCIMCEYIGGYYDHIGGVQYIGGYHHAYGEYHEHIGEVQYIEGYHEYIGGYHEYIWGCSVHRAFQ